MIGTQLESTARALVPSSRGKHVVNSASATIAEEPRAEVA